MWVCIRKAKAQSCMNLKGVHDRLCDKPRREFVELRKYRETYERRRILQHIETFIGVNFFVCFCFASKWNKLISCSQSKNCSKYLFTNEFRAVCISSLSGADFVCVLENNNKVLFLYLQHLHNIDKEFTRISHRNAK